jgi:hypothetical protein
MQQFTVHDIEMLKKYNYILNEQTISSKPSMLNVKIC